MIKRYTGVYYKGFLQTIWCCENFDESGENLIDINCCRSFNSLGKPKTVEEAKEIIIDWYKNNVLDFQQVELIFKTSEKKFYKNFVYPK